MTNANTIKRESVQERQGAEPTRSGQYFRPLVDILERKDELLILADMPGVSPDRIAVNFEDGALTIHGRVESRQPEDTNYLLQEYGIGDFYRVFEVSEQIDAARITAEYADGVLTLHLPKTESAKPRKISVQVK